MRFCVLLYLQVLALIAFWGCAWCVSCCCLDILCLIGCLWLVLIGGGCFACGLWVGYCLLGIAGC